MNNLLKILKKSGRGKIIYMEWSESKYQRRRKEIESKINYLLNIKHYLMERLEYTELRINRMNEWLEELELERKRVGIK